MVRGHHLRVVVRVFDTVLADQVERRFAIHAVRSTSALAAPWFVGAALGYDVVSTFYTERQPFLVARLVVAPGAVAFASQRLVLRVELLVLGVGDFMDAKVSFVTKFGLRMTITMQIREW